MEYEKMDDAALVDHIVRAEFSAFDKVKNEGGRADCQDNWGTFEIMRKSQYNTWNRDMLIRYASDFDSALAKGRNMIEEKYARMEESTAPEEWERLRDSFPVIDSETKAIIEAIVAIQVGWMEEFASRYPKLASGARRIHTREDTPYDTSYETYLRGEISTYSPQMLSLYGAFIADTASRGENLAQLTMEQSVKLYGYEGLDNAEEAL